MASRKDSRTKAASSRKQPVSKSQGMKRPAGSGTKSASTTSARSTVSGRIHKPGRAGARDAASAKLRAGVELLAAAFPHNAAKPSEFGANAIYPATGQAVEPEHPMVAGSTLSEINASPKVGRGSPQVGFNPGADRSTGYGSIPAGSALTTNQGVPIADNQNSLKAGLRGRRCSKISSSARRSRTSIMSAFPSGSCTRAVPARTAISSVTSRSRISRALRFRRSRQANAGVRAILDGGGRARLDGHRP